MKQAEILRHDTIEVLADHLLRRIPEDPFDSLVREDDDAGDIDGDDRIGGGSSQHAIAGLAVAQGILGSMSSEDLGDLPSGQLGQLHRLLIGDTHFACEQLHDAEHPAPGHHGEADRAMQSILLGVYGTRVDGGLRKVGDRYRPPALPYRSRQSLARQECHAPARLCEARDLHTIADPYLQQMKLPGLIVDTPENACLPAEVQAERFEKIAGSALEC